MPKIAKNGVFGALKMPYFRDLLVTAATCGATQYLPFNRCFSPTIE